MKQRTVVKDEVVKVSQEIRACGNLSDDGILDFPRYERAKPRILWLLKQEVGGYGLVDATRGECVGRDWHSYYPRAIQYDAKKNELLTSRTWGPMAITSHMLINDVDYAQAVQAGQDELADALLSTAIVEVDKEPGESVTPIKVLLDGFEKHKDFVGRQIMVYKPDIVIAGFPEPARSIVLHCQKLLGGVEDFNGWVWHEGWYSGYTELSGRMLLWTVHPSARKKTERYCTEILHSWRNMKVF